MRTIFLLMLCFFSSCQKNKDFNIKDFIAREGNNLFVPDTSSPSDAKSKLYFWYSRGTDGGGAVDVLGSPELFQLVFPGYPEEMRQDHSIWKKYFTSEFDSITYLPQLEPFHSHDFFVSTSWTGCFTLFEKYGANTIIFGSSEVFRSILPSAIKEQVQGKVLLCTTSGMPLEGLNTALSILKKMRTFSQLQNIVWGVSPWSLALSNKSLKAYAQEKFNFISNWERYSKREPNFIEDFLFFYTRVLTDSISKYFPRLDWSDFVPIRIDWVRRTELENFENIPADVEGGFLPPSLNHTNELAVMNWASGLKPYSHILSSLNENDCNLKKAENFLSPIFLSPDTSNIRWFLFIPPTLDIFNRAAPPCYYPAVKTYLDSLRKHSNIFVYSEDISAYGLNYLDFVHERGESNQHFLDPNHTNYRGAVKISGHLGYWIKETIGAKK